MKSADITVLDLQSQLWSKERIVLEVSTPHSHQERGKIENRIGAVRNMLEKSRELSTKKSYLEWESVGVCIANTLNNLPIARNGDDETESSLSFISPNHLLLGRNNKRSMELPVVIEGSTLSRLEDVQNTVDNMLDYIVNDIHKFVPGKRLVQGEIPQPGEIVLFISEENPRKRYEKFKYGKIKENFVQGRSNKVRIIYKNSGESVIRETTRNVRDIVIIMKIEDLDFNSAEQQLINRINSQYLLVKHVKC